MYKYKLLFSLIFGLACSVPVDIKKDEQPVGVQKTETFHSESINGKTAMEKEMTEKAVDANGKTLAEVQKTESQKDGEKPVVKTKVDIPSENIQSKRQDDEESIELDPPQDVANYIFETSDMDGVKQALKNIVQTEQVSQSEADGYMKKVLKHLDVMHDAALDQMKRDLENERRRESVAYQNMLSIVRQLNDQAQLKHQLRDYVAALYSQYKSNGDAYAKLMLTKFIDLVGDASDDVLDTEIKNQIQDIVKGGMDDVDVMLDSEQVADDKEQLEQSDVDVRELERLGGQ